MLPLAAMLSVASCGTPIAGIECAGLRPISTSRLDVITDQTQDQINAFNLWGERRGCWKRPGG